MSPSFTSNFHSSTPGQLRANQLAGYAKKVAARQKRQENKRKRKDAQASAEMEKENIRQAEIAANPKLAKQEAHEKQKAETILKNNLKNTRA